MPGVPWASQTKPQTIVDAVAVTQTIKTSTAVKVDGYREAVVLIDYDANAAGDVLALLPVGSVEDGSTKNTAPADGDDKWFIPTVNDGSVTAAVPSGITNTTGADFTLVPEFGTVAVYPAVVKLAAADNATDEYRVAVQLDITWMRWFQLRFYNDAASGGTLTAKLVLRV